MATRPGECATIRIIRAALWRACCAYRCGTYVLVCECMCVYVNVCVNACVCVCVCVCV